MDVWFCIAGRWAGQLARVIVIIIIAVLARLDPAAALPLIAGVGLGGWLIAGASRPRLAAA